MKDRDDKIFICECGSHEHQIVVQYDKDDNIIYGHIHLVNGNFFDRFVNGVKYIFGYKCKYGHWDEFIWSEEHADKLIEIANTLKKNK